MTILFITSNRLGDAVLSTGLLGHLLEASPSPRVWVACGAVPAPLFAAAPGVERVLPLIKRRWAGHWRDLWRACVPIRWRLVVDLRNTPVSRLLWASRRVGLPAVQPDQHKVAQLGATLGLAPPPAPRLWLPDTVQARAAGLIPAGPPVLALAPAAAWIGKTWPADRFIDLARRLTAADGILPGARLAVLGGEAERPALIPLLAALATATPAGTAIDLVGHVDPLTAAACLARCAMFIGNDSGVMHLAAAVGIPTLGLFGPSPPTRYAPWGPRCAVVTTTRSYEELTGGPDFHHLKPRSWMDGLSVDVAQEAAHGLWARTQMPPNVA